MADAFIVRRGGGGFSKCTIIVRCDSGYTVGAYSNSAATTLVKTGKEIGTSGDYVITGLEIGTYFVKAVKEGTQSAISNAVIFTGYGIKDVTLSFEVLFYDGGNDISMFSGGSYTTSYGGGLLLNGNSGVSSVSLFNIRNFSTMEVHARKATSAGMLADRCHVGVNSSYTDSYTSWAARASNSAAMSESSDTIITVDLSAISEEMQLCFFNSSSNPMVIRSVYLR